jgi:hypothetical protein
MQRRLRSISAIERANDRLTDRIAEGICAKTFAERAEENRVVLVQSTSASFVPK